DGNDTAIIETLTFTGNTTINTTKYFKTVNAGGITTSGFTGGTLAINGNRNTYKHDFALANSIPSITMEISKGGFPFTYWGCGLTSAQFKVDAPEGITKGTFTFVGKDGEPKSLAGTTTPSTLNSLVKELFLNWKCGLRVDDVLIGIRSVDFTISNNLLEDTAEIKETVPLAIPRLVRGGKRAITGTINRQFEDSTYFDKWINGTSAKLSVKGTSQPYAGPLETIEFIFPTILFEGTDPTVSDMSLMYNDLPFSAFGENNNEATLTIYSLDADYN
ncbi:MAG: phage tail tube protein, partial [bacterium]